MKILRAILAVVAIACLWGGMAQAETTPSVDTACEHIIYLDATGSMSAGKCNYCGENGKFSASIINLLSSLIKEYNCKPFPITADDDVVLQTFASISQKGGGFEDQPGREGIACKLRDLNAKLSNEVPGPTGGGIGPGLWPTFKRQCVEGYPQKARYRFYWVLTDNGWGVADNQNDVPLTFYQNLRDNEAFRYVWYIPLLDLDPGCGNLVLYVIMQDASVDSQAESSSEVGQNVKSSESEQQLHEFAERFEELLQATVAAYQFNGSPDHKRKCCRFKPSFVASEGNDGTKKIRVSLSGWKYSPASNTSNDKEKYIDMLGCDDAADWMYCNGLRADGEEDAYRVDVLCDKVKAPSPFEISRIDTVNGEGIEPVITVAGSGGSVALPSSSCSVKTFYGDDRKLQLTLRFKDEAKKALEEGKALDVILKVKYPTVISFTNGSFASDSPIAPDDSYLNSVPNLKHILYFEIFGGTDADSDTVNVEWDCRDQLIRCELLNESVGIWGLIENNMGKILALLAVAFCFKWWLNIKKG